MSAAEKSNFVIMADVHGNYELAARAIDSTDLDTVTPVFAGDFVNIGPDTAKVIDLIMGCGAVAIAGNHEWGLRNAAHAKAATFETEAAKIPRAYNNRQDPFNLLSSYGIEITDDRAQMKLELVAAMTQRGHLDFLDGLPPYFETGDFIVVHAGLRPDIPWCFQKEQLDARSHPELRAQEKPEQLFDDDHTLAKLTELPNFVTRKTVVSGHEHSRLACADRIFPGRILIGSPQDSVLALSMSRRTIRVFE